MRQTLVEKLMSYANSRPDLMVLSADLGYSVFEPLMQAHPDKFINIGIAEQNMMGAAAGLALCGKTVFAYSITPFATLRPLEQIRLDICYQNLPVRIIGAGAGLSYGTLGPTHHGTEDIAAMRLLPDMSVCAPADRFELAKIMDASMNEISGPMYIRIGRAKESDVHKSAPALKIGKGISVFDEGNDFAIISCGNMVHPSIEAARSLHLQGKSGKVISMHTIKPLDAHLVVSLAKDMPIITVEEHTIIGGLGSAVAELLLDENIAPPAFLRIALPDKFQKIVGRHDFLRQANGISSQDITKRIVCLLRH